ncbi:MAG TPA: DUF2817 domain-containing protein, partial [Patescibacteria group bacterium]|nr:DUF2817 domain-containing protein [Patescibacteria group bacterium]
MEKQNLHKKLILLIICLSAAVGISGCGGITGRNIFSFGIKKNYTIGRSVEKRLIRLSVLGNGENTTLFIAAIHGDEPAGTSLAAQLEKYLVDHRKLLKDKKVLIIPIANPDGFAAQTRSNANGIDLNRNFNADNRANNNRNGYFALSEPESEAIYKIIEKYQPQKVVSIHQPFACIDYDGPAAELAAIMSERCGLEVKKLGALCGSLGSYVGIEKNTAIITVELCE